MRTDAELLAAWRAGDTAAGQALVTRHWTSLSRFVRGKCDDSAEILSQTFLACVEGKDRIASDDVRAYLFAIARRRIADHFRRRTRAPVDLAHSSIVDLRTGPATALDRQRRQELLHAALARIPLDDQIALELAYFEGLAPREIAGVLEINENTVRSRLSRARDKLREVLATLGTASEAERAEARLEAASRSK